MLWPRCRGDAVLQTRRKEAANGMKRIYKQLVRILAAIIVFATTYALILPAITITLDDVMQGAGIVLEQLQSSAPAPVTYLDEAAASLPEEAAPLPETTSTPDTKDDADAVSPASDAAPAPEAPAAASDPAPVGDPEPAAEQDDPDLCLQLTGNIAADLVTVATAQLGCGESSDDYIVTRSGRRGRTPYGEWAGDPYGDWNAYFVAFCLDYAGIPADVMPRADAADAWLGRLIDDDMFADPEEHAPQAGDLIFRTEGGNIRIGIVAALAEGRLWIIEGDTGSDRVEAVACAPDSDDILGCGPLTGSDTVTEAVEENHHAPADDGLEAEDTADIVTYTGSAGDLKVTVQAAETALPAGTEMQVAAVDGSAIFDTVAGAVDGAVTDVSAVEIVFINGEEPVSPAEPVEITLSSELLSDENATVLGMDENSGIEIIDASGGDKVTFAADAPAVYAVVRTESISADYITAGGDTYRVTMHYDAAALIPEDAVLRVRELTGTQFEKYMADTADALQLDVADISYARFLDITIEAGGTEIQPAAPVDVTIELAGLRGDISEAQVLHFGSEAQPVPATVETSGSECTVSFVAEGFSVYAIVDTHTLPTASSVSELDGNSYYLSIDNNNARYYFKNSLNGNYIAKTNTSDIDSAGLYTFEKVEGAENQFYLSTLNADGETVYVTMNNNGRPSFTTDAGTAFTVEQHSDDDPGSFYIYYTNSSGKSMALWYNSGGFNCTANARGNNNKVTLTEAMGNDVYGLDGSSYGIVNNQNTVSATALLTQASNNNTRLSGRVMTVRTEPIKRTENVFVAENSDITMWSFRAVSGDQYHITAEVDRQLKYLRIDGTSVTLVDEADDNCVITVESGTGTYSGKYKFSNNGYALYLNGSTFSSAKDVTTGTGNGNYWMNLAELSNLNDDDFVVYTAEKVSVSGTVNPDGTIDYDVKDGDQVIIYTRIWNEDTLRYDYYAIDYDGMLIKAYESGDTISWVGSKVNTMLWDFTEYHYVDEYGNDTGVPNYYYELQNTYSGKYIAPQVSGTEFLQDSTIGINLNGRRNGEYYTTVLAWDDPYYDYAALKVQDWQLTSAPISKADTFYFAVMTPESSADQLTTVTTVDNTAYGITLKMQNYANVGSNNRSQTQTDVLQDLSYNQWTGVKDLLTKYIADGDYPTSTLTGRSLGDLFNDTLTVNNQFLMSTYRETGYFEYDSTQNFAHLITSASDRWYGQEAPGGGTYGIGDFVIYNQIASTTENGGPTRRHGQFFPYNDLQEGSFITNYVNDTDIHGNPLSSLDPRMGEKLYALKYKNAANTDPNYVDYFFGMEMSASFMQSESGLDAWGRDLIFEFSGDDDFWLYIDDVLVLDLGGIHSALDGSVNFRTGQVIENGDESNLRERFETAYKAQYPDKTPEEVNNWLNGIFKDDGTNTGTVFKDYSGHTMRMFYMERGAGASNLHMRFNLAPYTEGEVLLEKELSGVDSVDPGTVYPFQIQYHPADYPADRFEYVTESMSVTDTQTEEPIPFRASYEINGKTYQNVYLLKAGQTASVKLPTESTEYFITECGMDPSVYDVVKANDAVLTGTDTDGDGRRDFSVETAAVAARKKVIYNNHVSATAQHSLTVTKKLWEDFDKQTEITDDETEFRYRIYIGKDGADYVVYNTGRYYVKDRDGNYCIYQNGGFRSTGKTVFSDLSSVAAPGEWKSEQEQATFHTSPGGMADKIPAGFSIEIPGLMDGTAFYVIERDTEIPAGYNLIDYERVGQIPEGETANAGVIHGSDEGMIVNNQHGYGLTVNKVWSDAAFMEDHDEIYFAVYRRDAGGTLTLLTDTVRQLSKTGTSIRWFFPELADGKTLNDYLAYEVTLTDDHYSVDAATGIVTLQEGCTVTIIDDNDTLTVGGNTNEYGYSANFVYTASYSREELSAQQIADQVNVRTDTVSNSRPGIRLVKTDLAGEPLAGAVFSLVKASDPSTKKTFSSDDNGLIAVAYLTAGEDYVLTEIAAPYRHLALIDSLTIKVDSDGRLYVNGSDTAAGGDYYDITQVANPTAEVMPTVTVRNRAFTLQAVKVDAVNGEPIPGIKFALYREVMDYGRNLPMPDYTPKDGFEELVTDADGVIPQIDLDHLTAGTYYLREVQSSTQYVKLEHDIRLIISQTGQISIEKAVYSDSLGQWVFSEITDGSAEVVTDDQGNVTLFVRNTPAKGVQILKKNDLDEPLAGAEFALYKMSQISGGQPKENELPLLTARTTETGTIDLGALEPNSTYYLFETDAPSGYQKLASPVIINTLSDGTIQATLDNESLTVETVSGGADGMEVVQITVYNTSRVDLPSTGGAGTYGLILLGLILAAGSGLALFCRHIRRA